jgi:hypothetical protein
MKKIVFLLVLICTTAFSQKSINNYKYIIVPEKFDFFKVKDQYQTSSLTKFLFNKNSFTAFMSDEELPDDLAVNRCLALTVNVVDGSGMFTTKSVIELRDCYNTVVFKSKEGKSKIKDYKKAYHDAIRKAFNSVKALGYRYVDSKQNQAVVQKEITDKKVEAPVVAKDNAKVVKEKIDEPIKSSNTLYAQPTQNGYQLVDTKLEVVFHLLKTSNPNLFVIKDKNGVLIKKGNVWVAEYYKRGVIQTQNYSIKF